MNIKNMNIKDIVELGFFENSYIFERLEKEKHELLINEFLKYFKLKNYQYNDFVALESITDYVVYKNEKLMEIFLQNDDRLLKLINIFKGTLKFTINYDQLNEFLCDISNDGFNYLLYEFKIPIYFDNLDLYPYYDKGEFINEIIINDDNCNILAPVGATQLFTLKNGKTILLKKKNLKLESLKLIKINFSKKIIENMINSIIGSGDNINIFYYYKNELKKGNIKKFVNKRNDNDFVDLILNEFPDIKFDLTKMKYDSESLKKILRKKRFFEDEPLNFLNINRHYNEKIITMVYKYVPTLSLCVQSKKLLGDYYKNNNKISNEEFKILLNKVSKHHLEFKTNLIYNIFNTDQTLISIDNLELINNTFKIIDKLNVNFLINISKNFTPIEKDRFLFLIAKESFCVFCNIVFGLGKPTKSCVEKYFKTENKIWSINENHILVSGLLHPHKNIYYNLVFNYINNNEFQKINELYYVCNLKKNINICNLIKDKINDNLKTLLIDQNKVTFSLENYNFQLVFS